MTQKRVAPTKADIALLPPFADLPLEQIVVPDTPAAFTAAVEELSACRYVGFDTESKPTFKVGEVSAGPHIVQLSTLQKAFIFQLHRAGCIEALRILMSSTAVVKVGFGLRSDRRLLRLKLGIEPMAILDLDMVFRQQGYRKEMGVRAAVAVVFQQKFHKSKSVTMSNWAQPVLKDRQLLYAANDAYAPVKILDVLGVADEKLPILNRTEAVDTPPVKPSLASASPPPAPPQTCKE